MTVHPREHDLVIGTHGRAAYVLDDVRPLRELSPMTMAQPLHLFPIAEAQQYRVKQTGESRFPGQGEFRGENRPYGALITFSLNGGDLPHPDDAIERQRVEQRDEKARLAPRAKDAAKADETQDEPAKGPEVEIEITDAEGKVIRRLERPAMLGVNRIAWDLKSNAVKTPRDEEDEEEEGDDRGGPEVLPGRYTVTVRYRELVASQPVTVLADPRFDIPMADRLANWRGIQQAGRLGEVAAEAIDRIRAARSDLGVAQAKLKALAKARREATDGTESTDGTPSEPSLPGSESTKEADLQKEIAEVQTLLDALERTFWIPPKTKGIPVRETAWNKISRASWFIQSSWDAPTPAALDYLRQGRAALDQALADLNELLAGRVTALRTRLQAEGIGLLTEIAPLQSNESGSE